MILIRRQSSDPNLLAFVLSVPVFGDYLTNLTR
jgi:hypothetical protein